MCFRWCCITKMLLIIRPRTDCWRVSFRIFRVEFMIPSKAAPGHHTITSMFDCWYDVLVMTCCGSFMLAVTGLKPSKRFWFSLISPPKTFPKLFRSKMGFFEYVRMTLCFSFLWSVLVSSPMDAVFAQFLSYGGVLNTDTDWVLQMLFFCDLLGDLVRGSWGQTLLGRFSL